MSLRRLGFAPCWGPRIGIMAATATAAHAPSSALSVSAEDGAITSRVFARIGLLGNPSDGFFGKTISLSLANFHAEVCAVRVVRGLAAARSAAASWSLPSSRPARCTAPLSPCAAAADAAARAHSTRTHACKHHTNEQNNKKVTLTPIPGSTRVAFEPHATHDATAFDDLDALLERVEGQGYYGGVRLLMVLCCVLRAVLFAVCARDLCARTRVPSALSHH